MKNFQSGKQKLLVYSSMHNSPKIRLQFIKKVVIELAKELEIEYKSVKQPINFKQIYVYYKQENDDPIPIYCDEEKMEDLSHIQTKIKNMIFVLSFHPRYAKLKKLRNNLIKLC